MPAGGGGLKLPFPVSELTWERFDEVCGHMPHMGRDDVRAVLTMVLGEPPEDIAPGLHLCLNHSVLGGSEDAGA